MALAKVYREHQGQGNGTQHGFTWCAVKLDDPKKVVHLETDAETHETKEAAVEEAAKLFSVSPNEIEG